MPRQISEIQSIPFHQILGAPLLALVQGQAQAAQATAEFIERVGFIPPGETAEAGEIGNLRMITFTYQKPGLGDEIEIHRVEVPLLSMVPIPSIEIKEANLEFFVKITDLQSSRAQTSLSAQEAEAGDWLSQGRVEFRAAMGKMQIASAEERTIDLQMKVDMKVARADIPAGLEYLFRLMDQSISSTTALTPGETGEG